MQRGDWLGPPGSLLSWWVHLGEGLAHPQVTQVQDSEAGAGRAPGDLAAPGHNKPWLSKLDSVAGGVWAFALHRGDS